MYVKLPMSMEMTWWDFQLSTDNQNGLATNFFWRPNFFATLSRVLEIHSSYHFHHLCIRSAPQLKHVGETPCEFITKRFSGWSYTNWQLFQSAGEGHTWCIVTRQWWIINLYDREQTGDLYRSLVWMYSHAIPASQHVWSRLGKCR